MYTSGFIFIIRKALLPTTSLPFDNIGHGVPEINIDLQTSTDSHILATAATFIPKSDKTLASLRLLHSSSILYLPLDHPTTTVCTDDPIPFKHVSTPLDM